MSVGIVSGTEWPLPVSIIPNPDATFEQSFGYLEAKVPKPVSFMAGVTGQEADYRPSEYILRTLTSLVHARTDLRQVDPSGTQWVKKVVVAARGSFGTRTALRKHVDLDVDLIFDDDYQIFRHGDPHNTQTIKQALGEDLDGSILFERDALKKVLQAVWDILNDDTLNADRVLVPPPPTSHWWSVADGKTPDKWTRSISAQNVSTVVGVGPAQLDIPAIPIDLFIKVKTQIRGEEIIIGVDKDGVGGARRFQTTTFIPFEGVLTSADRLLTLVDRTALLTLKWWKNSLHLGGESTIKSHHLLIALNALYDLDPRDPLYLTRHPSKPWSISRVLDVMLRVLLFLNRAYNPPARFWITKGSSTDYPFPKFAYQTMDTLYVQAVLNEASYKDVITANVIPNFIARISKLVQFPPSVSPKELLAPPPPPSVAIGKFPAQKIEWVDAQKLLFGCNIVDFMAGLSFQEVDYAPLEKVLGGITNLVNARLNNVGVDPVIVVPRGSFSTRTAISGHVDLDLDLIFPEDYPIVDSLAQTTHTIKEVLGTDAFGENIIFTTDGLHSVLVAVWTSLNTLAGENVAIPDGWWTLNKKSIGELTRSIPAITTEAFGIAPPLEIDLFVKVKMKVAGGPEGVRGGLQRIVGVDKDGPAGARRYQSTEFLPTAGRWYGDNVLGPVDRTALLALKWWKGTLNDVTIKSHHLLSALNELHLLEPTDPLYVPKSTSLPFSLVDVLVVMVKILQFLLAAYDPTGKFFTVIGANPDGKGNTVSDFPFLLTHPEKMDILYFQANAISGNRDEVKLLLDSLALPNMIKGLNDALSAANVGGFKLVPGMYTNIWNP
ncbi:hypothetical protein JAAARDRAFT_194298 [Jaapia argillacea MUCL 33604]|uniref:Uncharacterized protein n=1 Tax=Jaapia argillacea MUCL 33604 TaxID=933084 RepID=A0A067Q0V3_9AGAM|nr:hypothetical protein JAAARDRAFT_194298 [Jaapia argillacea MUCL 33604]